MSLTDNYTARQGEPTPQIRNDDDLHLRSSVQIAFEELSLGRDAIGHLAVYLGEDRIPQGDDQAWDTVRRDLVKAVGAMHSLRGSLETIRGLTTGEIVFVTKGDK